MKLVAIALLLIAPAALMHAQDSVVTLAGLAQVPGAVNGPGTNALFNEPAGLAPDARGNLYVADSANNAIRILSTNGTVSTFAGQLGVAGALDGTGTNAQFNAPSGLAFDLNGNLLVADAGNATLRRISPTGAVTTIAGGAGTAGYADGPAGTALFGAPLGLAVAASGSVFVADAGNHIIRRLTAGVVSTFAGNPGVWGAADGPGTNAEFNAPCSLAFDAQGNLFVSDANNHTIRKITPVGLVTTFAGTAGVDGSTDGNSAAATFCHPAGIVFDHAGNLLVADSFNHLLRQISTNGLVSTISGTAGVYGDADGVNGQGRFFNPYGLAFDANGALRVADTYNELIREVLVPFKLTLLRNPVPSTVTLTWETVAGRQYQVQFTGNLAGSWTNLTGRLTATGFALSQTDTPPPGQSQRHYRVLLWP
jgi:hypothetical protein